MKIWYNICKYLSKYCFMYCTNYMTSLSEEDRLKLLNEETRLDYQCQQIKMKNCKHDQILLCKLCGEMFELKKEKIE